MKNERDFVIAIKNFHYLYCKSAKIKNLTIIKELLNK